AGPLHLGEIRVARDVGAVYFRLDLGRPVNVQSLPGTLELILDADGDTLTGRREGGLAGADLAIHFTRPDPARPGSLRSGISVHWLAPPPAGADSPNAADAWGDPYDIGLWLEPRTRTREIEVRVARGFALPGGGRAFEGKRLSARLVFLDPAGATRERTPEFELGLEGGPAAGAPVTESAGALAAESARGPPQPPESPRRVQVSLARPPGTDFRMLSWNVSRRSLQRAPDAFRRIVAAADPDLVLFDEVSPRIPLEKLEDLFAAVEEAAGKLAGPASRRGRGRWHLYRGTAGGAQRGLIAVRRTADNGANPAAEAAGPAQPQPVRELERLSYPDSVARIVAEDPRGPGLPEVAANLASRAGVPSAGAWVTLGGRRLLAVTLDLVCCGNHERSPQDRIRRIESARIAAAVRRAVSAGGPEGVVVAGDFNLVGTVAPLSRMAEALDVDGSDLAITRPLQLDGRSSATWDEGKGPFPPGELDYVLYSDASLAVGRTFILDSRDFSERTLRRYGLRWDDSRRASDHMPLVTDLSWKTGAPQP
ncbi:MAG: endonuclease/exonuclease/phosphatase family protein, partial [Gemmatimonadota bacterium]